MQQNIPIWKHFQIKRISINERCIWDLENAIIDNQEKLTSHFWIQILIASPPDQYKIKKCTPVTENVASSVTSSSLFWEPRGMAGEIKVIWEENKSSQTN